MNIYEEDITPINTAIAGALLGGGLGAGTAGLASLLRKKNDDETEGNEPSVLDRMLFGGIGGAGLGMLGGYRGAPVLRRAAAAMTEKKAYGGALSTLGRAAARQLLPPAIAGGAGYVAAPFIADKAGITSDMGRAAHQYATATSAAALASPIARRFLLTKPQGLKAALKGLPKNQAITGEAIKGLAGQRAFRPIAGPLTVAGMVGAPTTLGAYSDPTKRLVERIDKTLKDNPEQVSLRGAGQAMFEGALGKDTANQLRDDLANKGITEYIASSPTIKGVLGTGTGMVGGSALGYGTGALLGKLLMPKENADYDELDEAGYKSRRNRDRIKSLLKLVGMYGGSLAGGFLGGKYLPGLIDKLSKKEASDMDISRLAKLVAQKSADDCHCYPGGPADPGKKGCKDPDCDHCDKEAFDISSIAKAAASAAWQRKAGKNSKGGLNEKGRKSYERENPGSDLKAPVTGKVKPGGKAAKRRKSFCARMKGNKGPMKKPNGEPTRKALALRKWKC